VDFYGVRCLEILLSLSIIFSALMQKFERQEWQPASKRTRCNNFLGPHIILYWSSLLEVFTLPLLHFMNVCYFFVRFYLILPTYWCYVYVLNCC